MTGVKEILKTNITSRLNNSWRSVKLSQSPLKSMNTIKTNIIINSYLKNWNKIPRRCVSYVQGQEPEPKIREYFYYVDHQGMLFLDDARMKNFTSCFKELKFLRFFFNQLRKNNTDRYKEFPFISPCGKERNYVRCDDLPFVFTNVINKSLKTGEIEDHLAYNHAGNLLTFKFEPNRVVMIPETGRVYHPAPERAGSIGLIRSKLAIEFSKDFQFDNGESKPPTHFKFKDEVYKLDTEWYKAVIVNSSYQN